MPRLTKRLVDAAPVGITWDTSLPGFGIRVLNTGRRVFICRYRTASGTDRLVTIGTAAEFTPEQARDRATDIKRAARDGRDPKQERTEARQAPRLEDLRDRMLDEHCQQRRPRTKDSYAAAWRLYILPTLGNLTVADVSEADVLKLRRSMKDTPTAANRTLACLRKALNLAERWRWRPVNSNPCKWVEHYPEHKREHILTPDEVARVWDAIGKADILPNSKALFRLLMLTGLRRGEWLFSLWSWLDQNRALLCIPDSGSKTGARNVPLAPEVMDILKALPKTSVYILPGLTGGPIKSEQKAWKIVCKIAGVSGVRIHDLRHTIGSYAHEAGASQREIADLLGHKQLVTTERYLHGTKSDSHKNASRAASVIMKMI